MAAANPRGTPVALLAAIAGATFLATSALVRRAVPWPEAYGRRDKVEAFAAVADDVDVLLIGSSRTYRSFVPGVIEQELAARGHDLRVFNLGSAGMRTLEADHLLDAVLRMDPARLRWVFVEPGEWPGAEDETGTTFEQVHWHTPRLTWTAASVVLAGEGALRERAARAWRHVELGLRRATNLGQGPRIVGRLTGRPDSARVLPAAVTDPARGAGYRALEDDPEVAARRAEHLAHPEFWERDVDVLRTATRGRMGFRDAAIESLASRPMAGFHAAQVRRARRRGVELVYVVPPRNGPSGLILDLEVSGAAPVWNFAVPDEYPGLYGPALWFDRGHLSRAGADRFSRRFARRLAAALPPKDGRGG